LIWSESTPYKPKFGKLSNDEYLEISCRNGNLRRPAKKSPKVKTGLFNGGTPSDNRARGENSAPGFFGIEKNVVGPIGDWMTDNAPR
jgi:hypothetical protein